MQTEDFLWFGAYCWHKTAMPQQAVDALIELHVVQRTDWERIGVVNHKSEVQLGTFGVAICVSQK